MFYLGKPKEARETWRVERGEKALDLMRSALSGGEFLAADVFTIADVAPLAYTRLAREGGFDLSTRPAVLAWIARCETALGLAPATE
jgi:glutathione S-transferase